MLEPLGDPYTRFLPPAQYDSLYGLATGSVAGVGVSLFIDPVRASCGSIHPPTHPSVHPSTHPSIPGH